MLPDFVNPLFLNAVNFLIVKDNLVINPNFELLSSREIQNMSDMLSLMVLELIAAFLHSRNLETLYRINKLTSLNSFQVEPNQMANCNRLKRTVASGPSGCPRRTLS